MTHESTRDTAAPPAVEVGAVRPLPDPLADVAAWLPALRAWWDRLYEGGAREVTLSHHAVGRTVRALAYLLEENARLRGELTAAPAAPQARPESFELLDDNGRPRGRITLRLAPNEEVPSSW